jgi:polysaccharide deacetylase family protein (PEP-CTERM system associated)
MKEPSRLRRAPKSMLSVDVEDYFQVESFTDIVQRDDWESLPGRVFDNTLKVLDLFDSCSVKGTFFVLGWVASRHPALVREIAARGHELAVHSYWHRLVYSLDARQFRADTREAKDCIEQAGGVGVSGYRAPSYSITRQSIWALEILAEEGFRYDSSIFPIHHDVYGIPGAPRKPFRYPAAAGDLVEFPITTFRLGAGPNLPVGGGGYLRLFPLWFTRLGMRRAAAEGLTLVTYVHPWEIDGGQPRLAGRWLSRFRHYRNLEQTAGRLRALCAEIDYRPARELLAELDVSALPVWGAGG